MLGLLLIVKDRWMLLKTVTAFTVAHSITLAIATLGYANAPVLPLNAAIALSILFLGPEIVRSWRGETSLTIRKPWVVAFLFGLLHGFGFASALTSAGLPRERAAAGASELQRRASRSARCSFVLLVLLLERSFRQLEIRWPRWVEALPGYAVGSLGAFWTIQRTAIMFGIGTMTRAAPAAACLLAWPAVALRPHARWRGARLRAAASSIPSRVSTTSSR